MEESSETKTSKTGGWGWVGLEKMKAMWLHIWEASEGVEEAIDVLEFFFFVLIQKKKTLAYLCAQNTKEKTLGACGFTTSSIMACFWFIQREGVKEWRILVNE